jgi:sarcosine oxidase
MASKQSVIVLGLGIAGSSIAATLAQRGHKVTAIEQFSPLHDRGSSHGDTRIFRRVPHEGPAYVELADISLRGWQQWNQQSGEDLYLQTGGIDAGPESSPMVRASEELCLQYEQPFELLSGATLNRRHPHYNLPANWHVLFQPHSGVVHPDATRTFLHSLARAHGATLLHNTQVQAIEPNATSSASITVRTTAGSHTADHLIVAAGSWLPTLFPELSLNLTPERRVLAWFESTATPVPENSPIFIFDAEGGWYGMPTPGGRLKLGHDKHLRQQIDPNNQPIAPTEEDAAFLSTCIRKYFTGLNPQPAEMKPCIYTLTPDNNFLIDHHPHHENILLFSCCSGHGFKYAPAYGEIAASLLANTPTPDLTTFRLNRPQTPITRYTP